MPDYTQRKICPIVPPNLGWLQMRLTPEEMNYLWGRIENKKEESFKKKLAGNITESNQIIDEDGWFFNHAIIPLLYRYELEFGNIGARGIPVTGKHPYILESMWVNYQKQGEYNPLHKHDGIYSFVIWMKIPTDYEEQNLNNISNTPRNSSFEFTYLDLVGRQGGYRYPLSADYEGMMLFFPSTLFHQVYPFYNCEEERISIAGNILMDTTQSPPIDTL